MAGTQMTHFAKTTHKIFGKLLREFDGKAASNLPVCITHSDGFGFEIFSDSTKIGYVDDFWSSVHLENIEAIARIESAWTGKQSGRFVPIQLHLVAELPSLEKLQHLPDSSGIYLIWVKKVSAVYVGQTKCFKTRLRNHFRSLAFGTHINRDLQQLYIEHGFEEFEIQIADKLPNLWTGSVDDQSWLAVREKHWIHHYQSAPNTHCLNRTDGELIDTKATLEHKRKKEQAKAEEKARSDAAYDEKIRNEKRVLKQRIKDVEEKVASESRRTEPLQLRLSSQEAWLRENDTFFSFFYSRARKQQINETREEYNATKSRYHSEMELTGRLYQELRSLTQELKSKKTSKQLAHYSRLKRHSLYY